MEQIGAPSVEHGEKADLGPQVLGISADGEQGLRGGAEQDAVEFPLVLRLWLWQIRSGVRPASTASCSNLALRRIDRKPKRPGEASGLPRGDCKVATLPVQE